MTRFIPEYVDDSLDLKIFNKLRIRYLIALMAIAVAIISSELLVKNFLGKQLFDSRIVNVAGRQRMLSQKISKEVLLIFSETDAAKLEVHLNNMRSSLELWIQSHKGLQHGDSLLGLPAWNSSVVDSMFQVIKPHYDTMVVSTRYLLAQDPAVLANNKSLFERHFKTILSHESFFLEGMDNIVFQYDAEAKRKVKRLIYTEILLLVAALMILIFELIFIFTPIARYIRNIVADLIDSEEKEKKLNKELRKLYDSLEASQQELNELYYAVDQAIMFARTDSTGRITFLSDKFKSQLGYTRTPLGKNLFQLMRLQQITGEDLLRTINMDKGRSLWKNEVLTLDSTHKESWLMMTVVPVPNQQDNTHQLVVVGTDINERKQTEEQLKKATRERYQRQMAEQKIKSSLILEGQEKERRRISRDIHDGIGQMLTGLKFQLESMDWSQYDKSREKIGEIKALTTNIIKEVRRVSYNLAPSVLNDYGFISALNTMVQDLRNISKASITLENITNFDARLDRKMEINIFRIIQESLNNALKHARAENILISISHEENNLIIIIEDDGAGFAARKIIVNEIGKMGGHGIFNMKERAGFLEAALDIESSPGKGTTVKLEVPYKKYIR
jgi:PAS domain S-box-containing protein